MTESITVIGDKVYATVLVTTAVPDTLVQV
jgi:hypothetical protein